MCAWWRTRLAWLEAWGRWLGKLHPHQRIQSQDFQSVGQPVFEDPVKTESPLNNRSLSSNDKGNKNNQQQPGKRILARTS